MTANKMPLMLGNAVPVPVPVPVDLNDVDDLFGDGVGLSIAERSQSRQLLQRMDDLRSRGCCQAVAWSKSGSIATISPDGQSLELRFLRCSPLDGSWDLSEPTTCHLVSGAPGIPLVHLEWSTANSPELAVIDGVGRVAIVSFPISLNHPFMTRKWDANAIDDANAVVGSHWLAVAPSNQQKPYNVMYGPATRTGYQYQYESSFIHASGPSHPHLSKSALFCVTVNGTLKMFWSQINNRMEETTKELESVISSDELVTHAALASDKRYLLVAVATSSRQLRLIRIEIQWTGPGSQSDKNPPPQTARLSPSLVEKHLAATTWLQTVPGDASNDASMAELSYLHVLPSLSESGGQSTTAPMIVAVRSRAQNAGSYQMAQTILDRWEVVGEHRQNLHPAFEQLGTRRNSEPSEQSVGTRLKRLDPIVINKVVIGLQAVQFGKVLALTMTDGSVEYRDRFTFEQLYTSENTSKIMNLRQVGWAFSEQGSCQQVAFSPTHCSMILMSDDGRIRWSKLHLPDGDVGNSHQDVQYGASIAALTVTIASAMWYQANYDDMLAIVQPLTSKKRFTQDWINEIIRILKIQVDYSEELHHESLMRNAPLQSCLSIMNSLGFCGELKPRSFQSKFAMVELNVRNVVILITLASNTPVTAREKMSPWDEYEVVDALAGCAKWAVDLLSWLADSLFGLMNDDEFLAKLAPPRFAELTHYLHEQNNVALHLMLSSCSRSFLLALCRRISHMETLSTKAIEFYQRQSMGSADQPSRTMHNTELQQAYQKMQSITASSLVKVGEFERLLNGLATDTRSAYTQFLPAMVKSGSGGQQGKQVDAAIKVAQSQFELAMILAASPPPLFLPIIKKLFSVHLPALRALTDPARLFFADFELLGVLDDRASLAAKKARGVWVDTFRRAELRMRPGQQWRRCTRCASVMEEVSGTRPGFIFVLGQQRKCSCGGYWALLPEGKLIR